MFKICAYGTYQTTPYTCHWNRKDSWRRKVYRFYVMTKCSRSILPWSFSCLWEKATVYLHIYLPTADHLPTILNYSSAGAWLSGQSVRDNAPPPTRPIYWTPTAAKLPRVSTCKDKKWPKVVRVALDGRNSPPSPNTSSRIDQIWLPSAVRLRINIMTWIDARCQST